MNKEKKQNLTAVLYSYSAADFRDKLLDRISIEELIDLVLNSKDEKAEFRAAWAMEHILLSNRDLLTEHYNNILKIYYNTENWSVARSISKIVIELLKNPLKYIFYIDQNVSGLILDKSFKILENSNCPIAVRCNVYDICLLIGLDENWVFRELKNQIYYDLEKSPSPALLSRAKKVLKKLERYPHS